MQEELKPCPFCGSDEITAWYQGTKYGRIAYVECDICGAKTKAFKYLSEDKEYDDSDPGSKKAYAAWNRRNNA